MEVDSVPASDLTQDKQVQPTHKNLLQKHVLRSALPLPVYMTHQVGEGYPQQFRSSVQVEGEIYTCPATFARRKEAEENAAKLALESIASKVVQQGVPMIHNDNTFCKSILHEFASKMKKESPTYTTTESKGLFPSFITSVVFDGKTFEGAPAKSKKVAQQIGARTVIQWILGQPESCMTMAEIIKSKSRLFNFLNEHNSVKVPLGTSDGNGQAIISNENIPVPAPENPPEGIVLTPSQESHPEGVGSKQPILATTQTEEAVQIKQEFPSALPLLPSKSQGGTSANNEKKRARRKARKNNAKKRKQNEAATNPTVVSTPAA